MRRALHNSSTRFAGVAALAALAAGCSASSQDGVGLGARLGLSQTSPDEFLIIARDPLEVPQSFTLPPPQPGAPSRVAPDPLIDAQIAVFQRPGDQQLASASTGERALLGGAGAVGDNGAIRAELSDDRAPEGERKFGLTEVFGIPIPSEIDDFRSVLESGEENEILRQQGLPTPAAPPREDDDKSLSNGFSAQYRGG